MRGLVLFALFFSAFTNVLMLTGPLFMLQVYDRVLASRSEETLAGLFLLVVMLLVLYGVLDFARSRVMARVGLRLHERFAEALFRSRLLGQPGDGQPAHRDLDSLRTVFAAPVVLAICDLPWTPIFLATIFLFHPALGWLAAGGAGALTAIALFNQVRTRRSADRSSRHASSAIDIEAQAEVGKDLVRSQGMTAGLADRWQAQSAASAASATDAQDVTGALMSMSKSLRLLLQSAMLALGAWLVLAHSLTPGAMIAGSVLLGRALVPIDGAISQWGLVQRANAAWRRARAAARDFDTRPERTRLPRPTAQVTVRSLTVVGQRSEGLILSQVSFDLQPGEALGVIGRSGAGKTTLARAVLGLVQAAAGDVRIGGATPDQFGPALGDHVGYLPQTVQLFSGTVAENIARMSTAPDDGKVIAAAVRARAHDMILSLPEGYDTRVGPGGTPLSGGECQRIALARALYSDPVLLILDEPNSALDAEATEGLNAVVAAMKSAGNGAIVLTHRPTAIPMCDRLLVLENGRVKAFGPRDDVIRSSVRNAKDVQRVVHFGQGR